MIQRAHPRQVAIRQSASGHHADDRCRDRTPSHEPTNDEPKELVAPFVHAYSQADKQRRRLHQLRLPEPEVFLVSR